MPEIHDAMFNLRRLQEEYCAKENTLCIYFLDTGKAFDRVPEKVLEWAMWKKECY